MEGLVNLYVYNCILPLFLVFLYSNMWYVFLSDEFWFSQSLTRMLEQDAKNPTFVPQEQGMFTESATGLIVCVFQASGGNGEGALWATKRKKDRFAG